MKISTQTTKILAWISFVLIWALLSLLVSNSLYLPGPWEVLQSLGAILAEADSYLLLGLSAIRVLIGLALALLLGSLLGLLGGFFPRAKIFMSPMESLLRSVPVVSFIMLALLWLGSRGVPIFIGFLMTLPIFWSAVETSVREADRDLLEMMEVFDFSIRDRFKYYYFPWASSYLSLALRQAVGLAWKAAVAAEVLASTPFSLGRKIQESKVYLETSDLFAWTLLLLVLSFLMERLVAYEDK